MPTKLNYDVNDLLIFYMLVSDFFWTKSSKLLVDFYFFKTLVSVIMYWYNFLLFFVNSQLKEKKGTSK